MEVIEFLEQTNLRNLKFNIKSMVQASLRRINEELEERRLMLRHMLESEHLTYSEELALLTKQRIEEAARKRHEWFGIQRMERELETEKLRHMLESEHLTYSEELALLTKQRIEEAARKRHEWFGIQRMERELETEKFLKLKQLQREMESCEKARHLESKTLLMDSKRAQLYQIEEKEVMRQKEKKIKQMWLDVQRRFNEEMLEQDNLERKLLKVIAKSNQEMNSRNDECQKEINKINDKAARNEFAKEDASALLKDKLYMDRLKEMEKNKALSQHNVLTAQIKQNEENRKNTKQREINLELEVKKQNLWDILNNHYREEKQKIQDSVWQDHYIHHVRQENQRKHKESKEFDAMFLGTGCVLHPRNKIPYNKSTR